MRIMPAVLLLAALSGCGLKGDLYLPTPKEVPAPASAPAPSAQPEEDDKRRESASP
jgi:predicted small lipoprotein YifL